MGALAQFSTACRESVIACLCNKKKKRKSWTVFFAPSALKPPKAPTMKYWKTLLLVSLPERYFLKLGMTVVSFLPLVPRVKGELNSACEVEASARVRFCC